MAAPKLPLLGPTPAGAVDEDIGFPQKDVRTPWRNFFDTVRMLCFSLQQSGTTANRPTSFLWIGRRYIDTTLGVPIWILSVSSSGVATWINAAGVVV